MASTSAFASWKYEELTNLGFAERLQNLLNKHQPSRVTGATDGEANGVVFYYLEKRCKHSWKVHNSDWTTAGRHEIQSIMKEKDATIISYSVGNKNIVWAQPTSECKTDEPIK